MSSPPTEGRADGASGTLGDLLYADKTKEPIPETDWVELVQAVAAGDQLALRSLYERTHHVVFTLIMRITHSRETAEEVTLDVFHDLWLRAARYEATGGSVVGWIMNQARFRAIDRLRFEQRKKRVSPDADGPAPVPTASGSDEILDARQQERLLRNALTALTSEERQAIETAYFSGLTHAEVAARLNQPLGTVKSRIRAGLIKLKQILAVGVKGR